MSKVGLFLMNLMAGSLLADSAYELNATRMIYTNDLIYAGGGVTGRFNQAEMRADRMIANPVQGELSLEGNIFEKGSMVGQRMMTYNYVAEEVILVGKNGFGGTTKSRSCRAIGRGYVFINGCTCYDLFVGKAALLSLCTRSHSGAKSIFSARHLRLYVGGVPLFYLPYLKEVWIDRVWELGWLSWIDGCICQVEYGWL